MNVAIITRVRKWSRKVRGQIYEQYVIVIPKEVGKLLDPNKEYHITITEAVRRNQ